MEMVLSEAIAFQHHCLPAVGDRSQFDGSAGDSYLEQHPAGQGHLPPRPTPLLRGPVTGLPSANTFKRLPILHMFACYQAVLSFLVFGAFSESKAVVPVLLAMPSVFKQSATSRFYLMTLKALAKELSWRPFHNTKAT